MKTLDNVPIEYRELSERKAADLCGFHKTTLRRRHLVDGCDQPISRKHRADGSMYIPIEELIRLYGEKIFTNLKEILANGGKAKEPEKNHGSEPNVTSVLIPEEPEDQLKNQSISISSQDYLELKLKLQKLETEKLDLQSKADEIQGFYEDLKQSMKLLEDKSKAKEDAESEAKRVLNDALETEKGRADHALGIAQQLFEEHQAFNKLPWWKKLYKSFDTSNKNLFSGPSEGPEQAKTGTEPI